MEYSTEQHCEQHLLLIDSDIQIFGRFAQPTPQTWTCMRLRIDKTRTREEGK